MVSICICDDDSSFVEYLKKIIIQGMESIKIEYEIHTYLNPNELIFDLEEPRKQSDIYFLDICIGNENGIQIAKKIREKSKFVEIVFLSMYQEYVFKSFDVAPITYLLKEKLTLNDIKEVLEKAISLLEEKKEAMFQFKKGYSLIRIPYSKILYFEIKNRIVMINTVEKKEEIYATMEQIEQSIKEKNFVRIHRSFLVNMDWVEKIEKQHVFLSNEIELPIGAKYSKNVKKYMQFLLKEI